MVVKKKISILILFVLMVVLICLPVLALTDLQKKAADLNGDGEITQDDLDLMFEIGYPKRPKDGVEGKKDDQYIMDGTTTPSGDENSNPGDSTDSSSGDSSNVEGKNGYTKVYTVNGKTYKEFRQGSGTYSERKYSGGNIASSGCGPTAVSIVASGYGKNYNPGTLVDAACKKYGVDKFTACADSTGKMLTTAGLTYTSTFSLTEAQFRKHLKEGKPVVMSVNSSCGGLFTDATHYIAILDIKGDKAYVSNPNTRKATGWIEISKIMQCNRDSNRVAFLVN